MFEITHESLYGAPFRIFLKVQIKRQNLTHSNVMIRIYFLVHLLMHKRVQNRTKIHEFEGAFDGIIKNAPYSALRDLNKDEQEGAEVALKGALEVALVHNTCQCRSVYRMI